MLPVLLLLVAGAVDLGRVYFTTIALENAVKEGAFYGARDPACDTDATPTCSDPENVRAHVEVELDGLTITTFQAKCFAPGTTVFTGAGKVLADCEDGDLYYVRTQSPFSLITPIMSEIVGSSLTLTSDATAVVLTSFDPGSGTVIVPTTAPTASPAPGDVHGPGLHARSHATRRRRDRLVGQRRLSGCQPHEHRSQWAGRHVAERRARHRRRLRHPDDHRLEYAAGDADAGSDSLAHPIPGTHGNAGAECDAHWVTDTDSGSAVHRPDDDRSQDRTVAQGRWSTAGFSATNFSAVRPPNNDYNVAIQSIAVGLVRPCLTTTVSVDN